MSDDLDYILLEQLHLARKRKKLVRRLLKLLKNDLALEQGELIIDKRVQFLESMIQDKSLLEKKHKRKKQKDPDILAKNPVYEWYRTMFLATTFGYKMFMDSVTEYMSYFKKGRN